MQKSYTEFLHEILTFFSDKNNHNNSYEFMFGKSKLEIRYESGTYYDMNKEDRQSTVEYIAVRYLDFTQEYAPKYPVAYNSHQSQFFRKSELKQAINCFIHRATSKDPIQASELFKGVSIDTLQSELKK